MLFLYTALLTILVCLPNKTFCQLDNFPNGARSSSLGNASVTLEDCYAVSNNIAGIASLNKITIGSTFQNKFLLSNLYSGQLIGTIPYKRIVVAFSLEHFGDQLYNEQNISLGIAHQFSTIKIGLKTNYFQVQGSDFQTRDGFIINFGGIVDLNKNLKFGTYLTNINQYKIKNGNTQIIIPLLFKLGLSYKPIDKIIVNANISKQSFNKPATHIGIEYAIIKKLFVRSGISTNPYAHFFGMGFHHLQFKMDYSITVLQPLGTSQQISISYFLN